jgi:hypothetical protein
VDGEIKKVSLKDFRGQYVVLLFYPKDFTFVCPTELIAFSVKKRLQLSTLNMAAFKSPSLRMSMASPRPLPVDIDLSDPVGS